MDKHDIINELDNLKLRIMFDDGMKSPDEFLYDEWVDELLMRHKTWKPWEVINNKKWVEFNNLYALVADLYHKKNSHRKKYHEDKPEIMKTIKEIVAMVMFTQERIK